MRYGILGHLELRDGERTVALPQGRQRLLLAVLLLHANEPVSSDRLIDALWGESPPPTAGRGLHNLISALRKTLGNEALVTEGHGYVLRVGDGELDAQRFESLAEQGRAALAAGDAGGAAALLSEGLALWRGPPLADLDLASSGREELDRLGQLRSSARELRIEAELALGHHAEVIGELEALVAEYPLRERARGQLMVALYRCGRQADALAVYRQTRTLLQDELGLEPGAELHRLEMAILAHDPCLDLAGVGDAAPRPMAGPGSGRSAPPAVRDQRAADEHRDGVAGRRVRRGALAVAAGGVLLLAAAAAAVVAVLAGGGSSLVQVAPNSVAAIDTSTDRVVGAIAVGARPGEIAFGSGSLWVANVEDKTVSRVDPGHRRTTRTLSVGGAPTDLAASTDAVWVTTSQPNQSAVSVKRIDAAFDTVAPIRRVGNVTPGGPGAIAAEGDSIWVAPSSGLLTRLGSVTGHVLQRIEPRAGPSAVDTAGGATWVSDTEANNVTRIDRSGLVTPIAVGHGPHGLAVGEGGVWVADALDDALVHIDPSTRAVRTTIPVGRAPVGVAVGAGSVWVANSGDGTITRIDPDSDKVLATIAVGGSPQAIAVARGHAWVTVDASTATGGARDGGTLRMDFVDHIDPMDPAVAYWPPQWQLLYATCAKLLNYPDRSGPAGGRLTAEVAQSLPATSRDGRTYRFTIRPGFRFAPPSGERVTAQTFKDTIERTLDPRMNSPLAHEFVGIAGARAYMAGRAPHISGVVVRGDTLTIHLLFPVPDFLSRLAQPVLCAVPSNTPIDPEGVSVIPSAGPYSVTSFTPGQGLVLTRNPNYHGSRPHQFGRIALTMNVSSTRAVAHVEAGASDQTTLSGSSPATLRPLAARLSRRYGPGSPAAAAGGQRYFESPGLALDYLALNTHRPLFGDARLRRAVNYAIDRRALTRLGNGFVPLPEPPTDQLLPPGMPGFRPAHVYPPTPDLARARALAGGGRRNAVLYACSFPACLQQAQIVKNDLRAIGIHVDVRTFPYVALFTRMARPGEPFDLGLGGWVSDYPDPSAMLKPLLENGTDVPTFDDPAFKRRLAETDRLTGPRRYLAYGTLDVDLSRRAAPLVPFGNPTSHDFFSARIGCQSYGLYGLDLAALCLRPTSAGHH